MNGHLESQRPAQRTSFVGRRAELEELSRLVGTSRLLTITGAAGMGKTRLAIELTGLPLPAAAARVHFVSLAALTDGALVAQEVASRLGVREKAGEPVLRTLTVHIGASPILLVVDNCEHLVEASARLIEALLRDCDNLEVVATSRQPLRVPGEVVWRTEPLSRGDAVRLFEARARLVRSRFTVEPANAEAVELLCDRLEGIPLAIELAAARMEVLSVDDVLAQLEDRFRLLAGGAATVEPRHRTMQAALDWGHHLLDDQERRLFRRLSVFSGGFDLAAAEAVCAGAGMEVEEVGGVVFRLAERSLLVPETSRPGPTRYRLLETVRQYAAERLGRGGEQRLLAERHAYHYLALAERAAREERGQDQPGWLELLESNLANLRVALAWHRAYDAGGWLRLASSLSWFWVTHGYFTEGRRWLQDALAAAAPDAPARATALLATARLCFWQGDYDAARSAGDACLELYRQRGDETGCGWALALLASIDAYQGAYAESRRRFEEALALARDPLVRMEGLVGMGEMLLQAGEPVEARARLEEVVRLTRGPDAPRGRAALFLGLTAILEANYGEARAQLAWGLTIFHRLRNPYAAAGALDGLAAVAVCSSDPVRALRLSGAADALRDATRTHLAPRWQELLRTVVVEPARAAAADRAAAAWAEGARMSFDEAVRCALDGGSTAPAPIPPVVAATYCGPAGLTPRELEVAGLVARDMTNRQIAEQLVIAERTVEGHVERIRRKLGVRSRTLIATAMLKERAWPSA